MHALRYCKTLWDFLQSCEEWVLRYKPRVLEMGLEHFCCSCYFDLFWEFVDFVELEEHGREQVVNRHGGWTAAESAHFESSMSSCCSRPWKWGRSLLTRRVMVYVFLFIYIYIKYISKESLTIIDRWAMSLVHVFFKYWSRDRFRFQISVMDATLWGQWQRVLRLLLGAARKKKEEGDK